MASEAIASWNHMIDDFNYSPEDFYTLLKKKIETMEIPDVKTQTRNIRQGGILSKTRLYLEISRKEYIFHVCAAPFGKGYFFSWYLRTKLNRWQEILVRVPYIGASLVKGMEYTSYYNLDTTNMFKSSIHKCITKAIDEVITPKGNKRLSELERAIKD